MSTLQADRVINKRRYPAPRPEYMSDQRLDAQNVKANIIAGMALNREHIDLVDNIGIALRPFDGKKPSARIVAPLQDILGEKWRVYYGKRSHFEDQVEIHVWSADQDHPTLGYGGGIRWSFNKNEPITATDIDKRVDDSTKYVIAANERLQHEYDNAASTVAIYNSMIPAMQDLFKRMTMHFVSAAFNGEARNRV